MSSRQPVALNAMLCPHCMSVNDVAAVTCSKCGSPFSHESPGLAPLAGASQSAGGDLAVTAMSTVTAAANEPVHGEGASVSVEPQHHRFNRVQVVFREDGSARLEYSEAPPGEALVDEPAPAAATPEHPLPAHVGSAQNMAQLALPGLTHEPPIATAAPPSSGQWAAGPASMTAFAVGAAVATMVLVSGYLVYRSLVPSDTPRIAAQLPPLATRERPADARESARARAERLQPAAEAKRAATPLATTPGRQEPPAATIGSERLATSPAARPSLDAPATRSAETPPPPPVNVPCNAAVAALGLCTPIEPGRP